MQSSEFALEKPTVRSLVQRGDPRSLVLKEDKMERKSSLFIGIFLLVLGLFALVGNLILTASGLAFVRAFQLWPLFVIAAGMLFVMPPFFFPKVRGLAGLMVPGLPALTTGLILLVCNLTGNWGLWGILWPLEVIAAGLAFLFMAVWMRVIWLLIPAFLISFNGLVLGFCALSHLWGAWAVLWVIEPLALGLAFLVIGLTQHYRNLAILGAGFCAFAGLGVAASSFIVVSNFWLVQMVGPVFVMAMGVLMLVLGFMKTGKKVEPESGSN